MKIVSRKGAQVRADLPRGKMQYNAFFGMHRIVVILRPVFRRCQYAFQRQVIAGNRDGKGLQVVFAIVAGGRNGLFKRGE